MAADKKHDYHLVDPSPWPIFCSFATLILAVGAVYYFKTKSLWMLFIGSGVTLYGMFMWFRDVINEAEHKGDHTPVVQIGMRYGMVLFIISEVMFFVAWFWAYFDASLYPDAIGGSVWPPKGIETLDPWHIPLINTLILLLSGCTTTADHHYLFPKGAENSIDAQVAASRELGMRVTITRGSMSLGEDQGGLPPSEVLQNEEAILYDSARVASEYHDPEAGSFLQIALAPCSPFSVTTELMKETSLLANKVGLRMHTHLAETKDEIDFFAQKFNTTPLDYLDDLGWLNDRVWIAHGIHFSEEEILRLGENRVGVSHCPSSNMVLGSGICPALHLEEVGCPLGIGVDGSASNDCSNMIQELRVAFLLQRSKYGAQNISHLDVLRWGTKGSATCLGRSDIGEIAISRQADLAFFFDCRYICFC